MQLWLESPCLLRLAWIWLQTCRSRLLLGRAETRPFMMALLAPRNVEARISNPIPFPTRASMNQPATVRSLVIEIPLARVLPRASWRT